MNIKRFLLVCIVVVLFLVIATALFTNEKSDGVDKNNQVSSTTETSKETVKESIEIVKINSQVLSNEYQSNEIKADKKYKNKKAEITGEIEDIGEMFGILSINLKGDGFLNDVHCVFDSSYKDKIAELNKGDSITIVGIIEGYGLSVDIKNCSIK